MIDNFFFIFIRYGRRKNIVKTTHTIYLEETDLKAISSIKNNYR
ncbi:hypothetical protein [Paraclostridium sordellii]|nr:hypothetical protein [Paeniclostridium sordellii]